MGKQKRHFKGNNRTLDRNLRKEREEIWRNTSVEDRKSSAIPTDNIRFEAFYRAQGFVSDDEFTSFVDHLRLPLPACFRLNPNYVFCDELHQQLCSYVGTQIETDDGVKIDRVKKLLWYPGGVGYQLGTDRRSIRKLGVLKDLHNWYLYKVYVLDCLSES